MATTSVIRVARWASIGTAILAIAALIGFLAVVGSATISDAAASASFYVPASAALGSAILLAVALVGLFLYQRDRLGNVGVAGFFVALIGTVLAAGAQWTYVFVVPHFAGPVPELINESTGSVLAGFVLSYAIAAIGWVAFGLATLQARVFPRWAAFLLVAGGAIAFLPLPSRTLVLALAVGYLGLRMRGDAIRAEHPRAEASLGSVRA